MERGKERGRWKAEWSGYSGRDWDGEAGGRRWWMVGTGVGDRGGCRRSELCERVCEGIIPLDRRVWGPSSVPHTLTFTGDVSSLPCTTSSLRAGVVILAPATSRLR